MANVFIEEQTMTNIGSAIRTKKGTTDLILPEDMPEEILSIETGTDTSDATVTESDLAKDVVAYGANGRVVGNVNVYSNSAGWSNRTPKVEDSDLELSVVAGSCMFREGTTIFLKSPLSNFGTVTASDVASGKTFTSESGLKITGTLPEGSPSISDGDTTCVNGTSIKSGKLYQVPAEGVYVNYRAPDVRVLYSTATIVDDKIVLSNPLNVNGSSATEQKENYSTYRYFYGDLEDGSSDSEVYRYSSLTSSTSSGVVVLTTWNYKYYHQYVDKSIYLTTTNTSDVIVRNGTSFQIYDDISNFGNVEPSYVEEGRTFTSSSGLNIVGTGAQLLKKVTGSNNTTNTTTIDTGLRKIELFILYSTSTSIAGVGLVEAVWNGTTSYSYCSSYTSSTNYICQYINTDSSLINVNKGVVTYNGTGEKALKASTAWIAIGY